MCPEKFRQHHFVVLLKDAVSLNIWDSRRAKLVGSFLLLNWKIIFIKQDGELQDIWGEKIVAFLRLTITHSMPPLGVLELQLNPTTVEDRAQS